MIPHPSLFNVSRYEKRDTEKRESEIGNCPQYCSVYWPRDTEFVTFQGGHKCQCDWRINYSCIKIRKTTCRKPLVLPEICTSSFKCFSIIQIFGPQKIFLNFFSFKGCSREII